MKMKVIRGVLENFCKQKNLFVRVHLTPFLLRPSAVKKFLKKLKNRLNILAYIKVCLFYVCKHFGIILIDYDELV